MLDTKDRQAADVGQVKALVGSMRMALADAHRRVMSSTTPSIHGDSKGGDNSSSAVPSRSATAPRRAATPRSVSAGVGGYSRVTDPTSRRSSVDVDAQCNAYNDHESRYYHHAGYTPRSANCNDRHRSPARRDFMGSTPASPIPPAAEALLCAAATAIATSAAAHRHHHPTAAGRSPSVDNSMSSLQTTAVIDADTAAASRDRSPAKRQSSLKGEELTVVSKHDLIDEISGLRSLLNETQRQLTDQTVSKIRHQAIAAELAIALSSEQTLPTAATTAAGEHTEDGVDGDPAGKVQQQQAEELRILLRASEQAVEFLQVQLQDVTTENYHLTRETATLAVANKRLMCQVEQLTALLQSDSSESRNATISESAARRVLKTTAGQLASQVEILRSRLKLRDAAIEELQQQRIARKTKKQTASLAYYSARNTGCSKDLEITSTETLKVPPHVPCGVPSKGHAK
eukprot:Lankesteria_metandrocarpae@DN7355_c0_g1_i1.p1